MGGYGSGARNGSDTTEGYKALDIRRLHKNRAVVPGASIRWSWTLNGQPIASIDIQTQENRLILSYEHRSRSTELTKERYPVCLEWTECHYGGRRAWFICPAGGCGRRVAVLYGGRIFACRKCYQLSYPSQHESPAYRALGRAQVIRQHLGGSGDMDEPFPEKPKGMHWRTYNRLKRRYLWLEHSADHLALQQFCGAR